MQQGVPLCSPVRGLREALSYYTFFQRRELIDQEAEGREGTSGRKLTREWVIMWWVSWTPCKGKAPSLPAVQPENAAAVRIRNTNLEILKCLVKDCWLEPLKRKTDQVIKGQRPLTPCSSARASGPARLWRTLGCLLILRAPPAFLPPSHNPLKWRYSLQKREQVQNTYSNNVASAFVYLTLT